MLSASSTTSCITFKVISVVLIIKSVSILSAHMRLQSANFVLFDIVTWSFQVHFTAAEMPVSTRGGCAMAWMTAGITPMNLAVVSDQCQNYISCSVMKGVSSFLLFSHCEMSC